MPAQHRTNPNRFDGPNGHVKLHYGMYVGFIRLSEDEKFSGALRVWIPDISGTDDPISWITVGYCSPFGGSTPVDTNTKNDGFDGTQTSYGMWFVPPDNNVQVGVMFAGGNISRGYWIGCLFDEQMNNMVPDIASSTKSGEHGGVPVPVAEYNKKIGNDYTSPTRPVHTPAFDALSAQGLINDTIRGTSTSSARRDKTPSVFGISTPGPRNPNSTSNRMGGSRLIMDDGEGSEYLGLKTRGGNFIKLDDTNGLIYIINKDGTGWVQIDSNGDIDFYGAGSISFRAEEDVNIRADRNVNIEAGNNIQMKAAKDYSGTGYVAAPFGGAGGDIIIEANNKLDVTVFDDTKMTLKKQLEVKVLGDAFIKVDKNFNITTDNTICNSIKDTNINVGGNMVTTVNGDTDISTTGITKIFSTGDLLLKTDTNMKSTAMSNLDIFAGQSMKQTGMELNLVSSTTIKGTAAGVISWNGAPATPTTAITDIPKKSSIAVLPTSAASIHMNVKKNTLASFSSKFSRDTQSISTIASRFMTAEPCPEHMLKSATKNLSTKAWFPKNSLVGKPKARTYTVGPNDDPTVVPPNLQNLPEGEVAVPILATNFVCGSFTTPEHAFEGDLDKRGRIIPNEKKKAINPRELYDPLFKAASERYGVPMCILSRLCQAESGYNRYARNYIDSRYDYCAHGMMQILPRWHPLVKDPYDPNEVIPYAAKYLSDMYRMLGSWDKAIAGYNAGPYGVRGKIKKYGDNWFSYLPTETKNYVTSIGNSIGLFDQTAAVAATTPPTPPATT